MPDSTAWISFSSSASSRLARNTIVVSYSRNGSFLLRTPTRGRSGLVVTVLPRAPSRTAAHDGTKARLLEQSAQTFVELDDQRREHERNDRHQLEQDVERRSRCVLERVSHGVADHGRFVGVRSLPAEVPGFDVLLGIVPG